MKGANNPNYDLKLVKKYLIWILVFVASMMATRGVSSIVLLVMLIVAVTRKRSELLLNVVLLSSSLMLMNNTLAPKNTLSSVALKGQMILAAILLFGQIFGSRRNALLLPIMSIMPYIVFMIVPSAFGWCPTVSYLKLFLFTMVFFSYYGCTVQAMAGRDKARAYRSVMLSVAIFFVFGSLLVYPIPSISMMDYEAAMKSGGGSLYQGVTGHSQSLGVLAAVFGALLFADLVFNIQKADKLYIFLIVCAFILSYLSGSRTSMASLIAGIGFSTLLAMQARGVKATWRGKVVNSMVALATIGFMLIAAVPPLREKALDFALKYGKSAEAEVSSEAILSSRQGKLDEAIYNWRRSPYIGNGFQVSWDMKDLKVQGIKDILSAPVEKSTWTVAILEEGGVIGMLLFVVFLFVIFSKWIQRRAYLGLSAFFVFLMCNFGEFSLFSMSQDGGLFWFLVFFGLILDCWRIQQGKTPKVSSSQAGQTPPPPKSNGPQPKLTSIQMTPKMLRRFANRNA